MAVDVTGEDRDVSSSDLGNPGECSSPSLVASFACSDEAAKEFNGLCGMSTFLNKFGVRLRRLMVSLFILIGRRFPCNLK